MPLESLRARQRATHIYRNAKNSPVTAPALAGALGNLGWGEAATCYTARQVGGLGGEKSGRGKIDVPVQSQIAKDTLTYWMAARSVEPRNVSASPRTKRVLYKLAHNGSTETLRLAAGKALIRTVWPQHRL